jgi:hypothetical protein
MDNTEIKLAAIGHATSIQICRIHKGHAGNSAEVTGDDIVAIAEKMMAFMGVK